jgi:outer membrane immunogenic protein
MKKILLSSVALVGLTAGAFAADLPSRRVAPAPYVAVPVFTWTGFYVGVNAGYGFTNNDNNRNGVGTFAAGGAATTPALPAGTTLSNGFTGANSNDGFVGGGQVGYNYQFTPGSGVVVGIEADAQYTDFGGRIGGNNGNNFTFIGANGATLLPGVTPINPTGLGGLDFFGTVRGRLGYAFDRVLFYGTGGFAYGSAGGGQAVNTDDFKTGYAVGGGIEYALPTDSFLNFFRSSAVTIKVEGLYVNLDQNSRGAFANANGTLITATPFSQINANTSSVQLNNLARRDNDFAVVRAGLNYKFGSY